MGSTWDGGGPRWQACSELLGAGSCGGPTARKRRQKPKAILSSALNARDVEDSNSTFYGSDAFFLPGFSVSCRVPGSHSLSQVGRNVLLLPYRAAFVPLYHQWMEDGALREATASERLTLAEEFDMQREWKVDSRSESLCWLSSSSTIA
jgi:hypothetical protein